MRKFSIAALFLVTATVAGVAHAQVPPVRERLGARGGPIFTSGKLNESYGNGGNVVLHFAERIYRSFFLDVHIGAMYMGDLKDEELDDELFFTNGIVSEMRFLYFSVGPEYAAPIGERSTAYLTTGIGIYSVSIVLDDPGVQAFNYSDQHFGFNGGAGYMYRFTDNWNIDFNVTIQYIRTSSDFRDLYYNFTDGGSNPTVLEANLGVLIDLR